MSAAPLPQVRTVDTMDEAIVQMTALADALPMSDGLAAFNRMYLEVTQLVASTVDGQAFFAEPDLLAHLDVVFANRYLGALVAVSSGTPAPSCWGVLLHRRLEPAIHPLQFALAGMNAHINHDLVLSLVDLFTRYGRGPHDAALHADFLRVNGLLGRLEDRIRRSFMQSVPAQLEQKLGRVEDCVGRWSIVAARAAAWRDAVALWEVRAHPRLRAELARHLDTAVAAAGRCLLLPLTHHADPTAICPCPSHEPHLDGGA